MFRQNYRGRFQNQRRRTIRTVDVSLLVKKADLQASQPEEIITHQFSDFLINEDLQKNIFEKGYQKPTPIQDQIIPHILSGKDVIGIANTGTGKTGAFLIPLINKVLYNRSQRILILAPTRELALQIQDECKLFARGLDIFSTLIIGGASIYKQQAELKRHPHIVIGTPGRVKDLMLSGKINLSVFNNVVLDEVDRMMDMGFINDIKTIIGRLSSSRQSLFFTATLPKELLPLMHSFLKEPITISVKSQETSRNVDQDIIKLHGRLKVDVLHDLLAQPGFDRVLVFGRTKWGVEKLSKMLQQRGFKVAAIHGNKNQNQRQKALDAFKKGEIQVLLATDIASRGLDIEDVTHVINYDLPETYEDYIHRIGRTGRIDKKGIALSFVD